MSRDVWRCLQVFLEFLLWFGTCTLPCWIRWTCPDISRSRIPARQRVQRARAILFTDMKIHGFSPLTSMNKLDDQDSKKHTSGTLEPSSSWVFPGFPGLPFPSSLRRWASAFWSPSAHWWPQPHWSAPWATWWLGSARSRRMSCLGHGRRMAEKVFFLK